MLQIRHTVIFLFTIVAIDNINSVSIVTEKEKGNTRELEIRDDIATRNSSLEARSKNGRKIEFEKIKMPSGAPVSSTSPVDHSETELISQNPKNQSAIPSIDAHPQGLGAKKNNLKKKEPVNDCMICNNLDPKTELYNITSSFTEHGNTVEGNDRENEGDYDQDNDQENYEIDEGEDSEETDLNIQIFSHGHSGGGHGRHSGGHHSHHKGRHRGLRLTKVLMPTGKMASIAVPEQLKHWKCGRPTKLVTLNPHGRNGRREYKLVAKAVQSTKRQHFSGYFDHYRFIKIQKIVNGCFWRKYRMRQKEIQFEAKFVNERMLFHGTNKVKDLLKSGFDERFANIRGMFGAGIYFAKHSSKSNQYAFGLNQPCPAHRVMNCDMCERQMLLCRVTLGKVKKEMGPSQNAHAPPGYNSVEGVASLFGLQYPEYVVYRGEQVYPEYLITYKISV